MVGRVQDQPFVVIVAQRLIAALKTLQTDLFLAVNKKNQDP